MAPKGTGLPWKSSVISARFPTRASKFAEMAAPFVGTTSSGSGGNFNIFTIPGVDRNTVFPVGRQGRDNRVTKAIGVDPSPVLYFDVIAIFDMDNGKGVADGLPKGYSMFMRNN